MTNALKFRATAWELGDTGWRIHKKPILYNGKLHAGYELSKPGSEERFGLFTDLPSAQKYARELQKEKAA